MKKIIKIFFISVFLLQSFPCISFAATYQIDPVHSNIGFTVKHLMISTVRGKFNDYSGIIDYDPQNPGASQAGLTIQTSSIDTGNTDRDNHLRSADFLDAAVYPNISFSSKKFTGEGGLPVPHGGTYSAGQAGNFEIIGDLTIRGVKKEVSIPVTIAGPVKGPSGADVIALTGELTINRQDFGVSWNKQMDQGGLIVDNNIKIIVEIEAKK